jgi:hypothetical protein
MQIIPTELERSFGVAELRRSNLRHPADLFASGARSFEDRHGVGMADLVRQVFEKPTGVSAGVEGQWAARAAMIAFSQFLPIDNGPDFAPLSAFDHEPVPPRREFTLSVKVVHRGRPPALPIE